MKKKYFLSAVLALAVAGLIAITCVLIFFGENQSQNNDVPPAEQTVPRLTEQLYFNGETDLYGEQKTYKTQVKTQELSVRYENYPNACNTVAFKEDELINGVLQENTEQMSHLLQECKEGTLKKHPFADYQYFNTEPLQDDGTRVEQTITINTVNRGWRPLGFAMAGEVITLTFPKNFNYYNLISLNIGMSGNGGEEQNLNYNTFSDFRMPILSKSYHDFGKNFADYIVNDQIKLGSPLGGMVYLRINSTNLPPFEVTVKGVVQTPIYVLGQTTDEEWQIARTGLGLMAEIRMPSLRFVMTADNVRDVENMREVAEFWYRAVLLSEAASDQEGRDIPITMMYDTRVDYGAACAYQGGWWCQLPISWARGAVDLDSILANGTWGSFHELNHHYQGTHKAGGTWGMAGGGEVTNNVLNAMSYIENTNISAYRTEEGGLSGWNYVTHGYNTMKTVYSGSEDAKMLRSYVGLMHGFGTAKFTEFVQSYNDLWWQLEEQYFQKHNDYLARNSTSAFCLLATEVFEMDMRYYCSLFGYEVSKEVQEWVAEKKLPTYYPVFSPYANSYNGVKTASPFVVTCKDSYDFNFDLLAIDPSLSYTVKVAGAQNGKLEHLQGNTYRYTPKKGAIKEHFDLLVSLEGQTIRLGCDLIISYAYSESQMYRGVKANNIADALTQIAEITPITSRANTLSIAKFNYGSEKQLAVLNGKIAVEKTGVYTFYIKGDDKASVSFTAGGEQQTYELSSYITNYKKMFTLSLTKGEQIGYVVNLLNTGGDGELAIGYSYSVDGKKFGDIKAVGGGTELYLCNHENATALPEYQSNAVERVRPLRGITKKVTCDYELEVVSAPQKASNQEGGYELMTDGKEDTFYHTSYAGKGGATEFPCEFILHNPHGYAFNCLTVVFRRDTDRIGDYEVYVSDDQSSWKMVAEGKNGADRMVVQLEELDSKYIKIVAKNNAKGNGYLVVREFYLNMQVEDLRFMELKAKTEGEIQWSKQFLVPNGAFVGEGSLTFKVACGRLALYFDRDVAYGKVHLWIDGKEEAIIDLSSEQRTYNELLFYKKLNGGEHEIKLVSEGKINLTACAI